MYVDYKCLLYRVRVFFFFMILQFRVKYIIRTNFFLQSVNFTFVSLFYSIVALVTRKKMDLLQMLII